MENLGRFLKEIILVRFSARIPCFIVVYAMRGVLVEVSHLVWGVAACDVRVIHVYFSFDFLLNRSKNF